MQFQSDTAVMQHALLLAARGFGFVEPNPQVGAVIVSSDRQLIAEGWHAKFGGPHAEINAINAAAGNTAGKDIFVTLEPCSHHGKTPPCVDALLHAGFRRVVVGCPDPAPHAAGRGLQLLSNAGIVVEIGLCQEAAEALIAPFRRQMLERLPWVHAKWAMSLDGRIACDSGHSQWISSTSSRAAVHSLRGRVDAILTGAGTVRADNPLLTARPPGPRTPLRVIFDSRGTSVTADSRLVQSLGDCASDGVRFRPLQPEHTSAFVESGARSLRRRRPGNVPPRAVLAELGRRGLTHVLLEAGPALLGAFFDQQVVDEVHIFVSPKILGGTQPRSAVAGIGHSSVPSMAQLQHLQVRQLDSDVLIEGRWIRQ
ncbi:MAG UNVERIFIED_CONTAM: bifunctional diaminohydroxyphosphoribosylaminopyrimidine deaminase/5-amino-6-(5-phosphoribosylamino)uracil reductase RibD [Planctomycetaceae bacterium]